MLKKLFFTLAVFFLFSPQVFPQQSAGKFLILTRPKVSDRFSFRMAIWRSLELNRAGMEVHVIVQGESVLYFLGKEKFRAYDVPSHTMARPPLQTAAEKTMSVSTECVGAPVEGMVCQKVLMDGVYVSTMTAFTPKRLGKMNRHYFPARKGEAPKPFGADPFWELLSEFTAEHIPYTICSLSATQLGVYDSLKALGFPLSEDPTAPVSLTPYIDGNYQVLSY